MPLFPKEHGAYGQVLFPLIAAFAVAGHSTAGVLLAAAVAAGFLAHEPALVLLGHRGPRAKRELRRRALGWLACWALTGAASGVIALLTMHPPARWSLAVPLVPAMLLVAAALRGAEKSWYGETAAALAFSSAAFPIAMAGGLPAPVAATVAVPFALLFVSSTLAVRVVILRVRGGGDPTAVTITRRAALALAGTGAGLLGLLAAAEFVAASAIAAAAPGLLTAAAIAVYPPSPSRLRTVGWTLVAISLLTTAIVVTTTA
jgi:hypothetical protein